MNLNELEEEYLQDYEPDFDEIENREILLSSEIGDPLEK